MSITVIGDRGIGKTSMVVALAKHGTKHVHIVNNPEYIVARRLNIEENRIAGTAQMTQETLLVNIELASGTRQMQALLQKYYILLAEGGGQQASNIKQGFLETLITTT
jgi:GTPase SAR1 family protein